MSSGMIFAAVIIGFVGYAAFKDAKHSRENSVKVGVFCVAKYSYRVCCKKFVAATLHEPARLTECERGQSDIMNPMNVWQEIHKEQRK